MSACDGVFSHAETACFSVTIEPVTSRYLISPQFVLLNTHKVNFD
jgi:hypothetical protein